MRAELISNAYLPPFERHSKRALQRIRTIGWSDPAITPDESARTDSDGSPNHRLDWSHPVPFDQVAGTAVTTLIEVLGVDDPSAVRYEAFTATGTPILIPSLGEVAPEPTTDPERTAPLDAEQIAERLLVTLRRASSNESLERDEAGDIPLRFGSSVVFVRVFGDPPIIRIFSPRSATSRSTPTCSAR